VVTTQETPGAQVVVDALEAAMGVLEAVAAEDETYFPISQRIIEQALPIARAQAAELAEKDANQNYLEERLLKVLEERDAQAARVAKLEAVIGEMLWEWNHGKSELTFEESLERAAELIGATQPATPAGPMKPQGGAPNAGGEGRE